MGLRASFVGHYDESWLISNQHSPAIHINKNSSTADITTLTNHHQISQEIPLLKSDSSSKISRCRWCRREGHTIKPCYDFRTNGEGIVQDDHPSKNCFCSPVYHVPNKLCSEYTFAAIVLGKPPIQEFCCQSEVLAGVNDYIMDWTPDPFEGQNYYFPLQGEQRSTPKTTRKRKRVALSKKPWRKV